MDADLVNHPPHYVTAAGIEAIDVIERYGLETSFHLGNAAKYLLRSGRKGCAIQDLAKARWYLGRFHDLCERDGYDREPVACDTALEWAAPDQITAAFGIEGALAEAVRRLLWLAAAQTAGDYLDEIRMIQIAIDIAMAEAAPLLPEMVEC